MPPEFWFDAVAAVLLGGCLVLTWRYPPGKFVRDLVRTELDVIRSEEAAAQREAIEGDMAAAKERAK